MADVKQRDQARGSVRLPVALRWFWAANVAGALLTVLVAWLERRAGWPVEYWFPLQLPYFFDLMQYAPTFHLLHSAAFFHAADRFVYPPVAAVWFALLFATHHPIAVYLALAAVALGFALWRVMRALRAEGLARETAVLLPLTMLLCSFPLWRLVPQGNIELVLWMFAAAGVWRFVEGHDEQAAVLWGLAAATKLYPLIFLLLFVPRLKVRAFLLGMGTFVVSTVLALAWMGPSIATAWHGALHGVFGYTGARLGQWTMNTVATNHSAFTLVKVVAVIGGRNGDAWTLRYYAVGAALALLLYFVRLRKMSPANQVLGLTIIMLLLPTVSYFHTLTHLYAPWVMLVLIAVRAQKAGRKVPGLTGALWLFLPLFVSFTLFTFRSLFLFGGIIQAITLLFLLLYALQYPFATNEAEAG